MALIPDNPKQRNALLLGVLAVAVFYVFWSYWYSPRKAEVDEMSARLEQLETSNNRARIIATRGGAELQERLALYERHVERLERLIPQSEEVPALLNEITAEARRTGLNRGDVASFRPDVDEAGAFYTKQSYEFEVVGDYHDIGRFLTSIASLPRIITPVDFGLSPFSGNQTVLDPDIQTPLTAHFWIQTYILPTPADTTPSGDVEGQEGG
jgi:type IV pilus assembly protein PilO